jgi:hypothetical protein
MRKLDADQNKPSKLKRGLKRKKDGINYFYASHGIDSCTFTC